MKNRICIYPIALKCFFFFATCVYLEFIWSANRSHYAVHFVATWDCSWVRLATQWKYLPASSTCGYLRLLVSPELRVVLIYFVDFLRFQQHQSLAQSVKGSRYYQTIPPVQVECPLLDGDPTSIPIIFEDKYYFSEPKEPGICKPLCFGDFMPNFCNSRQTC